MVEDMRLIACVERVCQRRCVHTCQSEGVLMDKLRERVSVRCHLFSPQAWP